jgi:uncharacterized protein YbjQ (UPF0145 family)
MVIYARWCAVQIRGLVCQDDGGFGDGGSAVISPGDDDSLNGLDAVVSAEDAVPAMPVIRENEKYDAPHALNDAKRMIGWQWFRPAQGGPQFVILRWGNLGGYKVLERFPLTEEGWRSAWRSLSEDPVAAQKATARLAQRAAGDAEARRKAAEQAAERAMPVVIVTTNEVPGYRITEVHGGVFGLVVRARNVFSNIGAGFMTIAGGEVSGYTKLLTDSRNQALDRMWREARARGANAVIAMRFDCNEIGDIMSEVAAYGTAVTIEPLSAQVTTDQASAGDADEAISSPPAH